MASSEAASPNKSPSCVAWDSLVSRSVEAWYPPYKPTHAMAEDFLRSYTDLDDFLVKSGSMGTLTFWFFQRREAFLLQQIMTKWSRDRLDDYILLPALHGFVMRTECFFVSHYWQSQTDPDPGGKYLELVQRDLGLQSWSYAWVDWTCLPQHPRSDTEATYFRRALETNASNHSQLRFHVELPSLRTEIVDSVRGGRIFPHV